MQIILIWGSPLDFASFYSESIISFWDTTEGFISFAPYI